MIGYIVMVVIVNKFLVLWLFVQNVLLISL